MPRSSESVAALAAALAKAQTELINPEKSLTATMPTEKGRSRSNTSQADGDHTTGIDKSVAHDLCPAPVSQPRTPSLCSAFERRLSEFPSPDMTVGSEPETRMQQPCLVCGRKPSDPHHLRYMQPRALGRKASDEFAVPLCRVHHREVHRTADECAWWKAAGIDPAKAARKLWKQTRVNEGRMPAAAPAQPPVSAARLDARSSSTGADLG